MKDIPAVILQNIYANSVETLPVEPPDTGLWPVLIVIRLTRESHLSLPGAANTHQRQVIDLNYSEPRPVPQASSLTNKLDNRCDMMKM